MSPVRASNAYSCEEHLAIARIFEEMAWALTMPTPDSYRLYTFIEMLSGDTAPIGKGEEQIFSADALDHRRQDRFELIVSPLFVPPVENSIRTMDAEFGGAAFGPYTGRFSHHVKQCYVQCGFPWKELDWHGYSGTSQHADSLATECLFLAWIHKHCVNAEEKREGTDLSLTTVSPEEKDDEVVSSALEYGQNFAKDHLLVWLPMYAELLGARDDDVFSRLIRCFSQFVADLYMD